MSDEDDLQALQQWASNLTRTDWMWIKHAVELQTSCGICKLESIYTQLYKGLNRAYDGKETEDSSSSSNDEDQQ